MYKNRETDYNYVETDELGGKDPYSASKAAAEIIISGYRSSLRSQGISSPVIGVARGGNIVGGGDWSDDRLVPDFIKAYQSNESLVIRYPEATRPWQHVISLVDGYLSILTGMVSLDARKFDQAFNLGPKDNGQVSVSELLNLLSEAVPGVQIDTQPSELPEAEKLGVNSELASVVFGWNPIWNTEEVVSRTAAWYKEHLGGSDALTLCRNQILDWSSSFLQTHKQLD